MTLDDEKKRILIQIGEQLLAALDAVAQAARTQLGSTLSEPPVSVVAAGANPIVDGWSAWQNVAAIYSQVREQLLRLVREPFVARVVVRWEDEQPAREETLYITRASAAGMSTAVSDARVATYTAPLGRLAEFSAGESTTIVINRRAREVRIEERVRLRPEIRDDGWDALDNSFELVPWRVAVESVRSFLKEVGRAPISVEGFVPDVLGVLFEQGAQAALVRAVVRRRIVERIALRDQPILDRYQGNVFRLPLDRRLVLLGPPGTGKTTTLIRRLAQKRTPGALTEEEEEALSSAGLRQSFVQPHSWAMFSPTELLKLYLRDGFNREGVPAADENLRTWDKERLVLGRYVLGILRAAESGRFQLDEKADVLSDGSSHGIRNLYDEFAPHFETVVLGRCTDAFRQLQQCEDVPLRRLVAGLVRQLGFEERLTLRNVANLLDRASELQPELKRLDGEIDAELRRVGNQLLHRYPRLLPELVEALSQFVRDEWREDEEEDEDIEDGDAGMRGSELQSEEERRRAAAEVLLAALRQRARALALGRSSVGGRAGRVIAFLGDRLPVEEELSRLGERIITRTRLRTLVQTPRRFVMAAPAVYAQFRRVALREGRHFRAAATDAVRQGRISPDEADVLILTMLRNARRLLEQVRWRAMPSGSNGWLEEIQSRYLMQVFVDEATDFSAVQLACTMELSHPRLRCWFACGDFQQRVTSHGIQDRSEIEWLERACDDRIDVREVSIAYRQSRRLRELAAALSAQGDATSVAFRAPEDDEHTDVCPLLAEDLAGQALARWLTDRISEVERAIGRLPSMAVFVHGDAVIDELVDRVRPLLEEHNIRVVGSKDGRVVGDNLEVRVFDVRHIKGLEFEAVFFVGIDSVAERLPTLFEHFFLVGVSRAATYLGVTCEGRLPAGLERVRGHFASGGWQS